MCESLIRVLLFYNIMKNQNEIWKPIKNYEGLYEVSNLGNIKSLKFNREKILKFGMSKNYYAVKLFKNNVGKSRKVHQIVAESFLNHKRNGFELVVNHKNLIKIDNRVENLEIITQRENANLKHLPSSSKYTGVYFHKSGKKWASCIRIKKKTIHLGLFQTEIEAHNSYQEKLKQITL